MKAGRLKRISDAMLALLASLRLGGRGSAPETGTQLDQLGQCNEPMAIPLMMPLVFGGDSIVREKARGALLRLFAQLPIESLPTLDESLRSWASPAWFEGKLGDIVRMERATDADRLCIALLTCHRNG